MTHPVSSNAKKIAKLALLKLISRRVFPDGVTFRLLRVLGIDYEMRKEPVEKVFVSRFLGGCNGAFCISVDFDNRRDDRQEVDRAATLEILSLCEEFNIPVTWAICGVTAVKEKNVFQRILDSKIKHEIAIHTFDHIDFSSPECTEELAKSQILRTISLLPPGAGRETFIFPWNREEHFNILNELGFIAYRGRDRKLAYPSKNNGLWNIHPLFYLSEKNYTYSSVLKALLDLAISKEAVFHLWFHPWNLEKNGNASRYVKDTLRPLLEYADFKRRKGKLWICTLGDIANYCEARSKAKISFKEKGRSMDISVECRVEDTRFRKNQVLTLGIRIFKNVGKTTVFLDGSSIPAEELVFKKQDRRTGVLYLNLLFDKHFKNLHLDFEP
ncbi:MAG: polysaccharide deacetylase family protein [Thermoproteota archaeon]|nr:polysaccharide deacetylase family protein [Candidatus Brockarchaeota archaeon]